MKFIDELFKFRQHLNGGENKIVTYKGLLTEDERITFKKASSNERLQLINQLESEGRLSFKDNFSINWRDIFLKIKNFPKTILK